MIYLDTHVVVWLHINQPERLSPTAVRLIEAHDLLISPVVLMELDFLTETGRLKDKSSFIYEELNRRIDLCICERRFADIVKVATNITWTRDPFDRIIVAYAAFGDHQLVSKDRNIIKHYRHATW